MGKILALFMAIAADSWIAALILGGYIVLMIVLVVVFSAKRK